MDFLIESRRSAGGACASTLSRLRAGRAVDVLGVSLLATMTACAPEVKAQAAGSEPSTEPPISTDRPDFTDSPALVPRHSFQLEAGIKRTSSSGERKLEVGQLLFRYGLFDNSELRLAPNSYQVVDKTNSRSEGLEDIAISAKVALVPETKGAVPATSLLPSVSLDTGDSDISNGATVPGLTLLLGWELGGPFSLNSNLGWERAKTDNQRFDKYKASLSLAFQLSSRWSGFTEVYGFDREKPGGSSTSFADAGVIYFVSRTFSVDLTVGTGLGGTDVDYFAGFGFGKRW